MKSFSYKQFREAGYTIPNSNSDLVIEVSLVPMRWDSSRMEEALSFSYKGKFLFTLIKDRWSPSVTVENQENAIELGLITRPTHYYAESVIDALYYEFNPYKATKAQNVIKVSTIKALWNRFGNQRTLYSKVTQDLLKVLKKHIKDKVNLIPGIEPDSIKYHKEELNELISCGLSSRIGVCVLTGEYKITDNLRSFYLDNQVIKCSRDVVLSDYNLTLDGRHLLWPNQYLYDGVVYDESEGKVDCPCCTRSVPRSAFNTETQECIKCESRHYQIHNYSTKVPQILKFKATKVKPSTVYLGCELEFETTDKDKAKIKVGTALKNHAIMKSDGSIHNGFEVVTCPATLDIHLEEFKKFYSDFPNELINAPNVGMHVHVSRKPLSILQVGKLTAFMNNVKNKKFIEFIAGRSNNHYCTQDKDRTVTYPWTHQNGGARYNALNLCNKETIEFRIFSTPVTFNNFASNIQFCQALVDYCQPANLSLPLKQVIDYNNFINWVYASKKSYPELTQKIKEFN